MANEEYDRIEALLSRAESHIANVFRSIIAQLRGALDLDMLADALERGDLVALEQMFDSAAHQLGVATQTVFIEAGQQASDDINERLKVNMAFDQANMAAVEIMQSTTLRLIREFTDSQREVVRTVITDGIISGIGPRDQARNFRSVVGLTAWQVDRTNRYRRSLESIGQQDAERAIQRRALDFKLRDGRGDAQIRTALRDNQPLPRAKIEWLVQRYNERSIKARAEAIARTEALSAVHQGHSRAFDQAITEGRLDPREIIETWVSARDTRVRDSHQLLNGTTHPYGEIWQGLYGPIRFPGDPAAVAEERIGCRCIVTRRILGRIPNTP